VGFAGGSGYLEATAEVVDYVERLIKPLHRAVPVDAKAGYRRPAASLHQRATSIWITKNVPAFNVDAGPIQKPTDAIAERTVLELIQHIAFAAVGSGGFGHRGLPLKSMAAQYAISADTGKPLPVPTRLIYARRTRQR
jgi:hypothetical protein